MKKPYLADYIAKHCGFMADGFIGVFDQEHTNRLRETEPFTVKFGHYFCTEIKKSENPKHRLFFPLSFLDDDGHKIHDALMDLGYSNNLATYRVSRLIEQAKERRKGKEIDALNEEEIDTIKLVAECAARHPESLIFADLDIKLKSAFAILISTTNSIEGLANRKSEWWRQAGGVYIHDNNVVIIGSGVSQFNLFSTLGHELVHRYDFLKGNSTKFFNADILNTGREDYNKTRQIYEHWRDGKLNLEEKKFVKIWQKEAEKIRTQNQDIFEDLKPDHPRYGRALLFHMLARTNDMLHVTKSEASKMLYTDPNSEKWEVLPIFMEAGREFVHPHRYTQESAGYRLMGLICPGIWEVIKDNYLKLLREDYQKALKSDKFLPDTLLSLHATHEECYRDPRVK